MKRIRYDRLRAGVTYTDIPIPRLPPRGNGVTQPDDTSHLVLHMRLLNLEVGECYVHGDTNRTTLSRVIKNIRGDNPAMMFITRRLADDLWGVWRV